MGATNPKFAKSVRKPKKTKNIAQFRKGDKKKKKKIPKFELQKRIGSIQLLKEEIQGGIPNMKFGGVFTKRK